MAGSRVSSSALRRDQVATSRCPGLPCAVRAPWIPAFAGMTFVLLHSSVLAALGITRSAPEVIPAKAGIQRHSAALGPRFRGEDSRGRFAAAYVVHDGLRLLVVFLFMLMSACSKESTKPQAGGWMWEVVAGGMEPWAIWGASTTDVFMVGDHGMIAHFDGISWRRMKSGVNDNLAGVWGASHDDVFAVGASGTILHYDGTSWRLMAAGMPVDLVSIWGRSGSDVFAVSSYGLVFHYDGLSWTIMDAGDRSWLNDVWCAPGSDVFVTTNWKILRWNGTRWILDLEASPGEAFSMIRGSSGSNVYAAGDGLVHYDGYEWRRVSTPSEIDYFLSISTTQSGDLLALVNIQGEWMAGLYYFDGLKWSRMDLHSFDPDAVVWGTSPSNAVVAGSDGAFQYDGVAWRIMQGLDIHDLHATWGNAVGNMFAVGEFGAILRDDGTGWKTMNSPVDLELRGVWGTSDRNVIAVGAEGAIIHFDGANWASMTSPTMRGLHSVWGSSPNAVYAVGDSGTILRYDGAVWTMDSSGTSECLRKIWGNSSNDMYAAGCEGTLLHSDGSHWVRITTEVLAGIAGGWTASSSNIYIVAGGGVIRYNGIEWKWIPPSRESFQSVRGISREDVFAVTTNGTVWHFDGLQWEGPVAHVPWALRDIWCPTENDVYVVGDNGFILHGTRAGR